MFLIEDESRDLPLEALKSDCCCRFCQTRQKRAPTATSTVAAVNVNARVWPARILSVDSEEVCASACASVDEDLTVVVGKGVDPMLE